MLLFVLVVLFVLYICSSYSSDGEGIVGIVAFLIIYILCFSIAIGIPTNLLSTSERLEQEKEYLSNLPLPVDVSDELDVVDIDVANSNLATEILRIRFNTYEKIQRYNQSVRFWRRNPNLAYWLWGWPNPARGIQELDLKIINYESNR